MTERTMITAHSGCEGTEIDSIESIEKAIELGADVVEIDVRVGRWGTPRISHNELTILNNNQKIALADVFKKVADTFLKVNFDIKEPEAVIKVFEVAKRFNMPPERMIFTGSTTPAQLRRQPAFRDMGNFFFNVDYVLREVVTNKKKQLPADYYVLLRENIFLCLIDKDSSVPEKLVPVEMQERLRNCDIPETLQEEIMEDAVRVYQTSGAAGANLPKQLKASKLLDMLKEGNVPLSIWTVSEPEIVQWCLEYGACNITTRDVSQALEIRSHFEKKGVNILNRK